jgi:hypothetical protein
MTRQIISLTADGGDHGTIRPSDASNIFAAMTAPSPLFAMPLLSFDFTSVANRALLSVAKRTGDRYGQAHEAVEGVTASKHGLHCGND